MSRVLIDEKCESIAIAYCDNDINKARFGTAGSGRVWWGRARHGEARQGLVFSL